MTNVLRKSDTLSSMHPDRACYLNLFTLIMEGPTQASVPLGGWWGAVGQWHCVGVIPAKMWYESVCLSKSAQKACLSNSSEQIQTAYIRGASKKC